MKTEQDYKREQKRAEAEQIKPSKILKHKIILILNKGGLKKAVWDSSSSVKGWGKYIKQGYNIDLAFSFIRIDTEGFKDKTQEQEYFKKIKEVLEQNKIKFLEVENKYLHIEV